MRRRLFTVMSILSLLTIAAAVWLSVGPARFRAYAPIVTDISNGALVPDPNGEVRLPAKFTGIVPKDVVYVSRPADGRLLILFPTWYGHGSDLEGYLYASGPLRPADFYAVDWGPGGTHYHLDVGPYKILTVKPMAGKWYSVVRRLD